MKPRILIAGAGIGGLSAALALMKRGFEVQVLERTGELREVGAGVQLSANAVRALYQLGVGEALRAVASEPDGKCFRLWNTGQTWQLFDFGAQSSTQYGYPYFTLYRADLHRVLVDAVQAQRAGAIRLNAAVSDVAQTASGVTVRLDDGTQLAADVLIGADGVHSVVRNKVIAADKPRFSGCVAWRGVIPAASLPERLRQPLGVNWMGPGSHVVHYPLRRGELVNFVGILEKDEWPAESWTEQGSVQECLRDFAGWHEDVRALAGALSRPFLWALMVREPMNNWTDGRVTLLGDAAHPTLPFLSQGAAMAIEDGYILARCLDKYAGDPEHALKAYQDARLERAARIVRGSADNLGRFHNPVLAQPEGAAAYVEREWSEARVKERYDWIFSYNVDTAAI